MRLFRTHQPNQRRAPQRGAVLFILIAVLGIGVGVLLVAGLLRATQRLDADKQAAAVLAAAKDALKGHVVNPVGGGRPGDLLRPDSASETPGNYDGHADGGCLDVTKANGLPLIASAGNANMRCLGRLPWVDLGMSIPGAQENDPTGVMPWYAVSANLVDPACLDILNPDTVTLPTPTVTANSYTAVCHSASTLPHPWLTVRDGNGNVLSTRVAAVFIIPGPALPGQTRPASPSLAGAGAYLDTLTVPAGCTAPCVPGTYSNADMDNDFIMADPTATFNDRVLFITIDELMAAVAKRAAGEVGNALKAFYSYCGFYPRPVSFASSACYTGTCASDPAQTQGRLPFNPSAAGWALPWWFMDNRWDTVLYYAVGAGFVSGGNGSTLLGVDGSPAARALFFTPAVNTPTINRVAAPTTLPNYLLTAENSNLDTNFVFAGTNERGYLRTNGLPTSDVASNPAYSPPSPNPACLGPSTHVTFASDIGTFVPIGGTVTVDPATKTVSIVTSGGSGGCFWFPTALPLDGRTLRAYFQFTFLNADPVGGTDLGNGFTLSFVRGDFGAPNSCGTQSNMGALSASDLLGTVSLFVETDVHHDSADGDPAGNHVATMANGNRAHSALPGHNGYTTSACDGSAAGCYWPAILNQFEESPSPLTHVQRVEIHTRCDSTCGSCNSTNPADTYAQIKTWVDCTDCRDTYADFTGTATTSRCMPLDPALTNFYFGLTGGFSSTGGGQGVVIQNLDLRVQ